MPYKDPDRQRQAQREWWHRNKDKKKGTLNGTSTENALRKVG